MRVHGLAVAVGDGSRSRNSGLATRIERQRLERLDVVVPAAGRGGRRARRRPACWSGPARSPRRRCRRRRGSPTIDRVVEAVAVGQQHHDRDDAPRDAEHRQAARKRLRPTPCQASRTTSIDRSVRTPRTRVAQASGRSVEVASRRRHRRLRIAGVRHQASHLVAERLGRRQLRGAARRQRGRDDADGDQRAEREQRRSAR